MGKPNIDANVQAASETFTGHTKPKREPEDSMEFQPNCSDIGPVNDAYFAEKVAERGYPGVPTNQAEHMMGNGVAAGGCNQPLGPILPSVSIPTWIPGISPAMPNILPNIIDVAHKPGVFVEVTGEDKAQYEFLHLATQQSIDIVREVLPDILNRFLSKNADYGDGFDALDLGPKAEFVRIWNKVAKLKQALWDGKQLEHEKVEEVIDDFIGHLLLARLGLKKSG